MKFEYLKKIKFHINKYIKKYLKKYLDHDDEKVEINPLESILSSTIGEAMLPRSDIIAISCQASFQEVIKKFLKTGFHWLPVFRGTLDNIIGVVSIHCILSLYESDRTEKQWSHHLNHAFFAPAFMTVKEALHQFQHDNKEEVIFVVDEYGGIEGMITKGHIFKELCSLFIKDFSEEEMIISREPVWVFNGRIDLETFEKELEISHFFNYEDENRASTLGGWICAYVEHVPLKGEIITHPSGFIFEILQANPRMIHQVAVLQVPSKSKEIMIPT